jgi:hypothetical protein
MDPGSAKLSISTPPSRGKICTGSRIRTTAYKYRSRDQKKMKPVSAILRIFTGPGVRKALEWIPDPSAYTVCTGPRVKTAPDSQLGNTPYKYWHGGQKSTGSRIRNSKYKYWSRGQKSTGSRISNTAYNYQSKGQKSTGSWIRNIAYKYRSRGQKSTGSRIRVSAYK